MDFGGGDEIRFERRGRAGLVTLTRPKALNALTRPMVVALSRALSAWERDPAVALVVVMAEGRAFCAGGDIRKVYEGGKAGAPPIDFFADEYRLNAQIARFPKPYVSLVDGIVMGGGVGISGHGSHRAYTENAVFAMPEVTIGYFPDVGASFLLSRLKGSFGMYLALTAARIRAGDAVWAGLATHAVAASDLPGIVDALCETGQPDRCLHNAAIGAERKVDEAAAFAIARLFSPGALSDLLVGLRRGAGSGEEVATAAVAALERASPTSVAVAFRQINTGAMVEMDDCMRMEFRILNRMLAGHDFYEGVRAALIEKGSVPHWRPARFEDLDDAAIEAYFAPLPGGDLVL